MNFYRFIIARLNGKDIKKNFDYYRGLVRKGIAGFIIFGGDIETVRKGIKKLQSEAKTPLIIASDLERGLGQHLEGGTLFPPAMAIAEAIKESSKFKVPASGGSPPHTGGFAEEKRRQSSKLRILRHVFKATAEEARYAGINTIFAPVLDINTNPKNPIIATRAFGENAETVSFLGSEMIRTFQENGITACGKHFPGHGDTEIDSHIKLPAINKDLRSLEKTELVPFKIAVNQGVKMIMLGHLKVPALDSSGIPISLSEKAVSYLRNKMGFKGLIITDALNMGGIGKYSEEEAAAMALRAGVDILLHPTNPDRIAAYLEQKLSAFSHQPSAERLLRKKAVLSIPDFERNKRLSEKIARMAVKIDGQIKPLKNPLLIILNDDTEDKGNTLIKKLKLKHRNLKLLRFKTKENISLNSIHENRDIVVAIFSGIHAWKGGASTWLLNGIKKLEDRVDIFVSFGSPYIIDNTRGDVIKIYAYWDSEIAQKAVAEVIIQG